MVGREGFEPSKAEPADLQSDPVDRLGTYPHLEVISSVEPPEGFEPPTG